MQNKWSIEKGDYASRVGEYLKLEKAAERRKKIEVIIKLVLGIILIGLITILIV